MAVSASPDVKTRRFTVKDTHGRTMTGELRVVPVAAIRVDHHYQRDVSAAWVSANLPFDPQRAGAIVLSGRAGGPYVIDGQHRVALAHASDATTINALVLEGLTQSDEARLFVDFQRERRNLTSFALFTAEKVAQDAQTLAMIGCVNKAGFRLTKTASGPNDITAIDSVRYIHRYGGDDLLSRTLAVVDAMWIGEEKAVSGPVLKGLALFLHSAGRMTAFQRPVLEKVMALYGPMKMLRLAQEVAIERNAVSAGPANFAEALLKRYNVALPKGAQPLGPLTIGSKKRPAPYKRREATA
jgi:hypothetical protein